MSDEDSDHGHLAVPTELKNGDECEVVQVLATDHVDDADEEEHETPAKRQRTEEEPEEPQSNECVELDLVNFALVRCEGDEGDSSGQAKYQLVPTNTSEAGEGAQQQVYVIDETEVQSVEQVSTEYVAVMEGNDAAQALVIMEYPDGTEEIRDEDTTAPALLAQVMHGEEEDVSVDRPKSRVRHTLPPLHVMLSSPNLRLYLYSCRQCNFKCNAIKELTEHKKQSHVATHRSPGTRWRSVSQKPTLHQCPKCPYKAVSNAMLTKHMTFTHRSKVEDASSESTSSSDNDNDEESVVDLLVCAACGFESKDQDVFRKHVQRHKRLRK